MRISLGFGLVALVSLGMAPSGRLSPADDCICAAEATSDGYYEDGARVEFTTAGLQADITVGAFVGSLSGLPCTAQCSPGAGCTARVYAEIVWTGDQSLCIPASMNETQLECVNSNCGAYHRCCHAFAGGEGIGDVWNFDFPVSSGCGNAFRTELDFATRLEPEDCGTQGTVGLFEIKWAFDCSSCTPAYPLQ